MVQEGLMKGEYASDVMLLGWLPGHTRCAVAVDLDEGLGIQNDRGQQTLASCKSSVGRVNTCTHIKRTKLKSVVILKVRKIDKRMYLQVHLLDVMLHSRPVRFGKKRSGPSEIEEIFVGINPISVHEILVESVCQGLIRTLFFRHYGTDPIINHTGV